MKGAIQMILPRLALGKEGGGLLEMRINGPSLQTHFYFTNCVCLGLPLPPPFKHLHGKNSPFSTGLTGLCYAETESKSLAEESGASRYLTGSRV